jgi:hypothetical protein
MKGKLISMNENIAENIRSPEMFAFKEIQE